MTTGKDGSVGVGLRIETPGWAQVEARLRAVGRGGLRREIERAMRSSEQVVRAAARRGALSTLPKRGGLANIVAGTRFSAALSVRDQLTLRMSAEGHHDLEALNRGEFLHPVYGHRPWVPQSITPGWFDRAERDVEPVVVHNMETALTRTLRQIKK